MSTIQHGVNSNDLAVDSVPKAARVAPYDAAGNPLGAAANSQPSSPYGFLALGQNDRSLRPARSDRFGSLASALHTALHHDSFEGTTVNPIRWTVTATTMTAAQTTAGGLVINSGSITTINTGYLAQTARRFIKNQRCPMQFKARARLAHVNNSVMELGFGDATTFNGANTTGAYWQMTASGVLQPVLTYNGVDQTGSDVRSLINLANYYTFDILVDDDAAIFMVQDTSTGLILSEQSIKLPISGVRLWSSSQIGAQARLYNSGTAPASAPQLIVSDTYVFGLDLNRNAPWPHQAATLERGFSANPFTGAQLSTWANSAEPANATLSNTAAGYTTLGGKFQFAAPAGAVTDFALFGFQVPSPANLVITGVDIETWNTGAAVATTPTLLTWGLAVGSSAVSLASATVNRVGLGAQSLPVGAAVGALAARISKTFQTPLHCPAGRFFHVILRVPVGTATASQVVAGMVNIEGYFD